MQVVGELGWLRTLFSWRMTTSADLGAPKKGLLPSEGYIAETGREAMEKSQQRSLTFLRQRKYPVEGQCLDMRNKTPDKRDNFFVEMTR